MGYHQHDLDCIVVEGGRGRHPRPRCQVTGQFIGEWWKKPFTLAGKHVRCTHGMPVFLVDGNYIRNHFDSDFTQGTGWNYRFIPRGEIWLDSAMPRSEWSHMILHECCEAEKLKQGKSIVSAYYAAKKLEDKARKETR